MPNGDNGDKSSLKNSTLNRRNILLGGTTGLFRSMVLGKTA
jgi:hypothetical protein